MEKWKDITGYEGIYSVSNFGRIRRDLPYRTTKKGKILSSNPTGNPPYPRVTIRGKQCWTHILVATEFIGPRPIGKYVNHKDGNKSNNKVSNLEYATPKENNDHARKLGINIGAVGEKAHSHKLTEKEVLEIRKRFSDGETNITHLAREYGISQGTMSFLIHRKTWKHI